MGRVLQFSGCTYWAERRRENGHDGAYAVPYWGLGNEMYGEWQIGGLSAEEYTREAIRWVGRSGRSTPKQSSSAVD